MMNQPGRRKPTISLIVPAKNEARNLPHVLPLIPADVDEVILVDGASSDNTIEVARRLRPDIRVVAQPGKGKGNALRAGFAAARGDIIVMIDADGSTDPREIPVFVGALVAGADLVKGSRFMQGGGSADITPLRKVGNWGLTMLVTLLYGGHFTDLTYGYMAFWRRILPPLELDGDGFDLETMMNVRALRAGLRVAEAPSFEAERIHGQSNLNTFRDGWLVFTVIMREATRPQQRVAPGQPTAQRLAASTDLAPSHPNRVGSLMGFQFEPLTEVLAEPERLK